MNMNLACLERELRQRKIVLLEHCVLFILTFYNIISTSTFWSYCEACLCVLNLRICKSKV